MRTLDKLMDMRAEEYTNDDIDEIIVQVRKRLAMYEAGIKPKREAEEQIDMAAIIANITKGKPQPPAPKMKRRM